MKFLPFLFISLLLANCKKNKVDNTPCIDLSSNEIDISDSLRIINCNDFHLSVYFNNDDVNMIALIPSDTLYHKFNSLGKQTIHYIKSKTISTSKGFTTEINVK